MDDVDRKGFISLANLNGPSNGDDNDLRVAKLLLDYCEATRGGFLYRDYGRRAAKAAKGGLVG